MSYHIDKEVNRAIIKLLDALCEHERNSGRRSTFILVPEEKDEAIVVCQDGKPVKDQGVRTIFDLALDNRENISPEFRGR